MAFEFSVSHAGRIRSADVVYLDGKLQAGTILSGAIATVKGDPAKHVTIKSVALVNTKAVDLNRLTLSIDDPGFPVAELEGTVLVGEE